MSLTEYRELEQGSEAWLEARRGILTASVIGQLVTPTLKVAANDTSRALVNELVAQRITGWVEPTFTSYAMARGNADEPLARDLYSNTYTPATQMGFMVLDHHYGRIGWSPDGLVGVDGAIEVKSAEPKIHLARILSDKVPAEHVAQCQTALFVSGRKWIDYLSYCGGMPMWVKRVTPDEDWFEAIAKALEAFEVSSAVMIGNYNTATRYLPTTERVDYFAEPELKL